MQEKNSCLCFFLTAMLSILALSYSSSSLSASDALTNNSSLSSLNTNSINSVFPADKAFSLEVLLETKNTIVLMWTIEPGYYLYRKSLGIYENNKDLISTALIPAGKMIEDEFFGNTEVYLDKLIIKLPVKLASNQSIQLELNYQGCAELGYCYPVQQKSITLTMP